MSVNPFLFCSQRSQVQIEQEMLQTLTKCKNIFVRKLQQHLRHYDVSHDAFLPKLLKRVQIYGKTLCIKMLKIRLRSNDHLQGFAGAIN